MRIDVRLKQYGGRMCGMQIVRSSWQLHRNDVRLKRYGGRRCNMHIMQSSKYLSRNGTQDRKHTWSDFLSKALPSEHQML